MCILKIHVQVSVPDNLNSVKVEDLSPILLSWLCISTHLQLGLFFSLLTELSKQVRQDLEWTLLLVGGQILSIIQDKLLNSYYLRIQKYNQTTNLWKCYLFVPDNEPLEVLTFCSTNCEYTDTTKFCYSIIKIYYLKSEHESWPDKYSAHCEQHTKDIRTDFRSFKCASHLKQVN